MDETLVDFLFFLSFIAFITGIVGLIKGRLKFLNIQRRQQAFKLMAFSFVLLLFLTPLLKTGDDLETFNPSGIEVDGGKEEKQEKAEKKEQIDKQEGQKYVKKKNRRKE